MNEAIVENLDSLLAASIRKHASTESLQAVIDKQIGEIIADAVKRELQTYGDIGKQLREKVKAALQIPDLDLPAYGHMVAARFKTAAEETIDGLIQRTIAEEMNELFNLAPPVLKMESVIEALRTYCREMEVSRRFYFEAEIKEDDVRSAFWIGIDPDEGDVKRSHSKHNQHFRLLVAPVEFRSNGSPPIDWCKDHFKIAAMWLNGTDASKVQRFGSMWEWEKMIFSAYACKTPIILGDIDPSREVWND